MTSCPVRAAGLVIYKNILMDNGSMKTLFLLLKHNNSRFSWWTPPKGHLEKNETPLEAAIRETKEETHLINDKDYFILPDFKKELHYKVQKKGVMCDKIVTYWLAELNSSVDINSIQISDEHTDYKWGDLETACDIAGFNETNSLLQDCFSFIQNGK